MRVKAIIGRIIVAVAAVAFPFFCLSKDIYGSFLFTIPVVLIWQIGLRGRSLSALGLQGFSFSSLLIGLVSGVLMGLLCGKILQLLGITGYTLGISHAQEYSLGSFDIVLPLGRELGYRLLIRSASLKGALLYFAFSLAAVGFGEEFFWRGFIQSRLDAYLPDRLAIVITALLFSLVHFYILTITPLAAGLSFLLLIACAGFIWGYMRLRFNNIWACALSHGICAFIIWKYYFFHV
jgi:membrane protease YdiL (CAAX protease family)